MLESMVFECEDVSFNIYYKIYEWENVSMLEWVVSECKHSSFNI